MTYGLSLPSINKKPYLRPRLIHSKTKQNKNNNIAKIFHLIEIKKRNDYNDIIYETKSKQITAFLLKSEQFVSLGRPCIKNTGTQYCNIRICERGHSSSSIGCNTDILSLLSLLHFLGSCFFIIFFFFFGDGEVDDATSRKKFNGIFLNFTARLTL